MATDNVTIVEKKHHDLELASKKLPGYPDTSIYPKSYTIKLPKEKLHPLTNDCDYSKKKKD